MGSMVKPGQHWIGKIEGIPDGGAFIVVNVLGDLVEVRAETTEMVAEVDRHKMESGKHGWYLIKDAV